MGQHHCSTASAASPQWLRQVARQQPCDPKCWLSPPRHRCFLLSVVLVIAACSTHPPPQVLTMGCSSSSPKLYTSSPSRAAREMSTARACTRGGRQGRAAAGGQRHSTKGASCGRVQPAPLLQAALAERLPARAVSQHPRPSAHPPTWRNSWGRESWETKARYIRVALRYSTWQYVAVRGGTGRLGQLKVHATVHVTSSHGTPQHTTAARLPKRTHPLPVLASDSDVGLPAHL